MRELSMHEMNEVNGGRFKLHFNVFQAVFTVVSAGILGGPVGAGIALGAVIGTQGLGNLHEMAVNELSGGQQ